MDANSETDAVISYYICDTANSEQRTYTFHPAFPIYDKILAILKEYEVKNSFKFTEKEKRVFINAASNNFHTLEKELYPSPNQDGELSQNEAKLRRMIFKIIAKLEKTKESKSPPSGANLTDYNTAGQEKGLRSNGSNRKLEPLNEHTNSVSSAFD
jgi:hypothetical protein